MLSNSQKTSKKIGLFIRNTKAGQLIVRMRSMPSGFFIFQNLLEKVNQLFIIPIVNKNLYNIINMNGKTGVVKKSGGVVFDGEKFFVVKRNKYNDISLPKGHIDPGESSQQAAIREVLEETGLECQIVGDLGTTEYLNFEGIVQVQYFAMRVKEKVSDNLFPDVDEIITGNYKKIEKLLSYPTDKKIFEKGGIFFDCTK